jgi:ABC-2 type transport system permease protein
MFMMRGLWRLTWLEIKIFVREPLGLIGTVGVPVLMFAVLGRLVSPRLERGSATATRIAAVDLPVFASLLIAISVVLSLVTVIAIYRESGILKRLRATPLRPVTILTAHVLVKLLFTAVTLGAMLLAGRRFYPVVTEVPVISFALALLFSTACILSMGFVIASVVPTARFAQPFGTLLLYPMLGVSGLFIPVDSLPPWLQVISRTLPLTYASALLKGVWRGDGWLAHVGDVAVLAFMFLVLTVVASRLFRWE